MFRRSDSSVQTSSRLVETLDLIEKRVEILRQQASAVEQEKLCLIELIETVQGSKDLANVSEVEREDINLTAIRLMERCHTVDVHISTPRNEAQSTALSLVHQYIDEELLCRLKADLTGCKSLCNALLNACLSEPNGPVDFKFQAMVIGCAVDDQKNIRKRLESLFKTIEHSELNL